MSKQKRPRRFADAGVAMFGAASHHEPEERIGFWKFLPKPHLLFAAHGQINDQYRLFATGRSSSFTHVKSTEPSTTPPVLLCHGRSWAD
ncbi:MAG TPA: hypothetical protein VGH08_10720 [Chthoniobacterales bacterium]|jgi:hypothetical protein